MVLLSLQGHHYCNLQFLMVSNSRLLSKPAGLLPKLSFLDESYALLTLEGPVCPEHLDGSCTIIKCKIKPYQIIIHELMV